MEKYTVQWRTLKEINVEYELIQLAQYRVYLQWMFSRKEIFPSSSVDVNSDAES